jgi:hypothetical protein
MPIASAQYPTRAITRLTALSLDVELGEWAYPLFALFFAVVVAYLARR